MELQVNVEALVKSLQQQRNEALDLAAQQAGHIGYLQQRIAELEGKSQYQLETTEEDVA